MPYRNSVMSAPPKTLSLTWITRRPLALTGSLSSKHAETVEATDGEAEIGTGTIEVEKEDLDATHRQTSASPVVELVTGKYH
jgi:hypothetical protein